MSTAYISHLDTDTVIAEINNFASRSGDAPALFSPKKRPLSYAKLGAQIESIRDKLISFGLSRNDRIALVVKERPQSCLAFLAVASHATVVPLDPNATEHELTVALKQVGARAVIGSSGTQTIQRAAKAASAAMIDLSPDPETSAIFSLKSDVVAPSVSIAAQDVPRPSDIAAILMSSGTTGTPKAIPISHRVALSRARLDLAGLGLTSTDVCMNFRPTHLSSALGVSLISVMVSGGAVLIPEDFNADQFYDDLANFGVTWYNAGPAHHAAILDRAAAHRDKLARSRLRMVRSSSTPLTPALQERVETELGVPCLHNYATTETGTIACNPLPPAKRKAGTVGLAFGCDIRISDDKGCELPRGAEGEIVVRGPQVFEGYDNDPVRTSQVLADAWYRTGDIGRLDDEGYLVLCGRLNSIINRGGQKVSATEVEDVLCAHPAVEDAVCFPQPHPTLGSVPAAAVVLKVGSRLENEEFIKFLRARLSSFKLPVRIVSCEAIPRSATGKLLRAKATAQFQLQQAAPLAAAGVKKPPRADDALVKLLATIWADELGVDSVDLDTDFFTLGGDSLQATTLLLAVENVTGVNFDAEALTGTASTVRGMASAILALRRGPSTPVAVQYNRLEDALQGLVEIASGWPVGNLGVRAPISVINGCGTLPPVFWCFSNPYEPPAMAGSLGADQPIYVLRSLNQVVFDKSHKRSIEPELGRLYAAEIARLVPTGSLRLGGNCQGGRIIVEAARTLEKMGRHVELLALLEHEPLEPYDKPLAMYFGAQSTTHNPFLLRQNPEQEWVRKFPVSDWHIIPGQHGEFWFGQNLHIFMHWFKRRLARATSNTGFVKSNQRKKKCDF